MDECGSENDPSREFVPDEEVRNCSNNVAGLTDPELESIVVRGA
jgi:hypothetical protein